MCTAKTGQTHRLILVFAGHTCCVDGFIILVFRSWTLSESLTTWLTTFNHLNVRPNTQVTTLTSFFFLFKLMRGERIQIPL